MNGYSASFLCPETNYIGVVEKIKKTVATQKPTVSKAIHNQTENILPDASVKNHGPKCIT